MRLLSSNEYGPTHKLFPLEHYFVGAIKEIDKRDWH
jgi:hypothetical protein